MIPPLIFTLPSEKKSVSIHIAPGLLQNGPFLKTLFSKLGRKFAILVDDTVKPIFGVPLKALLIKQGFKVELFSLPPGEANKTRAILEKVENEMFAKGFGKEDAIIAIGGGVTLDLAGFLAATYCRGIPYVNVPTTLLAMVDAAIGGKTGLDNSFGKNMIGAVYQPRFILSDIDTLHSLPPAQFRDGFAECIKHAALFDEQLFCRLETNKEALFAKDLSVLIKLVEDNSRIKAAIVSEDQHDKGKRNLLNFGHTIGHALEKLSSYKISHGEAVALGMLMESRLFVDLKILDLASYRRLHSLIKAYGFPLDIPKMDEKEFLDTLSHDKKSVDSAPRFIGIEKIGSPYLLNGNYCVSIPPSYLKQALYYDLHDA